MLNFNVKFVKSTEKQATAEGKRYGMVSVVVRYTNIVLSLIWCGSLLVEFYLFYCWVYYNIWMKKIV